MGEGRGGVQRSMLKEDDGAKMMLFFGFVGLLNMLALFPIVLVLVEAGFVSISGLTLRLFMLAVAKGRGPVSACVPWGTVLRPIPSPRASTSCLDTGPQN